MARNVPMTTTAAPNPPPPGGDEVPQEGTKAYEKFLKKLEKMGFYIDKNGKIQEKGNALDIAGPKNLSAEELALLQKAWNLFGLENGEYDVHRVYYDKGTGDYYNLGTGASSSGQNAPPSDEQLALWQSLSGYDPEYEMLYYQQHFADQGNGYIPKAFQDMDAFLKYQQAALANYRTSTGAPTGTEQQVPGTWTYEQPAPEEETWPGKEQGRPQEYATQVASSFDMLDDNSLFAINDTVSQMLQARKQRASARTFQSDFFDMSDFEMEE